jgi:hypothetical protein
MIQIILIIILIISLFFTNKKTPLVYPNISGQYQILQKNPYDNNMITINLILNKENENEYYSNELNVKTILNNIYMESNNLKIKVIITDDLLKGGRKIIFKERKNNKIINYIGYINNKNIFILNNNKDIFKLIKI